MPKYDYRCNDCGHIYEKREGFDAPSVQACPECAGTARRVLTPPAIVFKGSGWYVTDHRKGSDSESSASSSSNGAKSETSSKSSDTSKSEAPAST
jgi:putative FmdB family regulatory protein